MPLISTLPNFFTQAAPTDADINTAAGAIGEPLGAMYWDQANARYTQATGKLDSNNISSTANIKNSQKAEPFGCFALTNAVRSVNVGSATTYASMVAPMVVPPLGFPYYITSLHLATDGRGNASSLMVLQLFGNNTTTQSFIYLLLNDSVVASVGAGSIAESAGVLPVHFPMGTISVSSSDIVTVDLSQLPITNLIVGGGGSYVGLTVSLMCKTAHIRGTT